MAQKPHTYSITKTLIVIDTDLGNGFIVAILVRFRIVYSYHLKTKCIGDMLPTLLLKHEMLMLTVSHKYCLVVTFLEPIFHNQHKHGVR